MRRYSKKHYTPEQREWCINYERATTFEPLLDSYESGIGTFGDSVRISLRWFEDWMHDAFHTAERCEVSEAGLMRRLPPDTTGEGEGK